jgi:hypothetical protein
VSNIPLLIAASLILSSRQDFKFWFDMTTPSMASVLTTTLQCTWWICAIPREINDVHGGISPVLGEYPRTKTVAFLKEICQTDLMTESISLFLYNYKEDSLHSPSPPFSYLSSSFLSPFPLVLPPFLPPPCPPAFLISYAPQLLPLPLLQLPLNLSFRSFPPSPPPCPPASLISYAPQLLPLLLLPLPLLKIAPPPHLSSSFLSTFHPFRSLLSSLSSSTLSSCYSNFLCSSASAPPPPAPTSPPASSQPFLSFLPLFPPPPCPTASLIPYAPQLLPLLLLPPSSPPAYSHPFL